jgi:hypothetical protein
MMPSPSRHRAFVLLEAVLAVAIFALGVLSLGKCVTNCLDAERFKTEGTLVWRALENRLAELEAGAHPLIDSQELLPAPFAGVTLKQRCMPLSKRNEKGVEMTNLLAVTLDASWRSGRETRSRQLVFYVHPRNP